MRILLDYRPALKQRTGVGEFVHELARALVRTGSDEVVLVSSSIRDRPSAQAQAELAGARIVDRRIPVRALTWAWNRLDWPPVEWLAGDADVVHSQNPLLIPTRRAARVVTIHDLDFLTNPERTEAEMRRDFPALAREHALKADRVVVSSRHAAGEVMRLLGMSHDRISVCSPGAPAWTADIARARAERGHVPGPFLFLGTLEPRKNIGTLLDAYIRVRQKRPDAPGLILAGRARAAAAPALERLRQAPLAGHVSAPGYVSDGQRQALYRDAGILVLPSLQEGFGFPVLEAMACGVPVVVSDRGSLPEVAGDAASPVEATDADALAREMERLLDPAAALVAADCGTRQAATYSWDACAAAVREAYAAAVEFRRSRGRLANAGRARAS